MRNQKSFEEIQGSFFAQGIEEEILFCDFLSQKRLQRIARPNRNASGGVDVPQH